MAEVKSFIFGVLFVIAILSFGAGMFSFAVVMGGWSTSYPSSFTNAESYLNKTNTITSKLANQTAKVGESPASVDPTLTYGTILTVGLQILTIPIDAVNLIISMLTDIATTPTIGGYLPGWFVAVAILFVIVTVILGILAAVVKWYL